MENVASILMIDNQDIPMDSVFFHISLDENAFIGGITESLHIDTIHEMARIDKEILEAKCECKRNELLTVYRHDLEWRRDAEELLKFHSDNNTVCSGLFVNLSELRGYIGFDSNGNRHFIEISLSNTRENISRKIGAVLDNPRLLNEKLISDVNHFKSVRNISREKAKNDFKKEEVVFLFENLSSMIDMDEKTIMLGNTSTGRSHEDNWSLSVSSSTTKKGNHGSTTTESHTSTRGTRDIGSKQSGFEFYNSINSVVLNYIECSNLDDGIGSLRLLYNKGLSDLKRLHLIV